jgi:hypothetical protein
LLSFIVDIISRYKDSMILLQHSYTHITIMLQCSNHFLMSDKNIVIGFFFADILFYRIFVAETIGYGYKMLVYS